MKINRLNIIIFIGLIAIIGVLVMQLLTINQAYNFERNEMSEKIHFALRDVVYRIFRDNKSEIPITNQVKKVTEDYYIVNVNDVFEANVLEYYLKNEFEKVKLETDFEYAIYDCGSDKMMYGNYISVSDKKVGKCENCFTKKEGYTYYFAVRFPKLKYSYATSLRNYWIFTGILLLILVTYVYSILILLKQKKYTELQADFINNMTHEFKTPLASILIASNYANSQSEIKDHPKLSKYMQIIINQSNKLNQHIERILNVAKSDGKWVDIEKSPVSLTDTIGLVRENALLKSSHQDSITFDESKKYTVNADSFHLYNIIYNIVDNAIKYSGNDPKIMISIVENKKGIAVQFKDNGSGISSTHIDYVFDKFYRVPRENKKDIEGFGIGLFYVKKIIDLHQWKISMENNTDQGVTVSILIPNKDVL